jgi:hypothetical protein
MIAQGKRAKWIARGTLRHRHGQDQCGYWSCRMWEAGTTSEATKRQLE